jgi:hypothetical protein
MKRPLTVLLLISFSLVGLIGCNKDAMKADRAAPSPTPAEIASSAQVVKVSSPAVTVAHNGSTDAIVTLSISPGFHVNANPATFNYLIASEVTPGKLEGITTAAPAYPVPQKKKFQFADQPLAVYEGEAPIRITLRAEQTAPAGTRSLPISVRVQACDEEQCFPPATITSTIALTVK